MGKRHFFGQYALWIILAALACAPMLFSYAGKAVKHNANRVEDWLPGRYIETKQLSWFRQQFVADQFVIVSWDGCRLGGDPSDPDAEPDDPRIAELAQVLVQNSKPKSTTPVPEPSLAPQSADTSAPDPTQRDYFKSVTTAREILDQLTAPPTSLSYEDAVERLKGSLIGPDGHQTCLVVAISESGAKHLRDAIGRGFQGKRLIQRQPGELFKRAATVGLDQEEIHLGGPPVDNVAIDEEGEKTLLRLSSLAGLLGLGLCWSSLRSVRLTIIVFICAILSGAAGLAMVALTGQATDAVLMSMPALVYVLSISASVHLINHYREAIADHGPTGAVERAIGHGWKPAFLCTLTTALGLISLCTSELTPIRKFGFYSAVGVFAMLAVSFLVLPAALEVWHKRKLEREAKRNANAPKSQRKAAIVQADVDRMSEMPSRFEAFWQWLGGGIIRRHAWVTFACLAFIVTMSVGVTRLKTSIDLLKLFDPHARILQDYAWLEKNLGRLVPMELVLRFPAATTITSEAQSQAGDQAAEYAGRLSFLDRLETASMVEQSIKKTFGEQGKDIVGQTVSAATFAPADPGQQSGPRVMRFARRSAASQQLEQSRPAFESTGFLGLDPADHAELWRVSVRVAAFQNVDYGQFVRELRDGVEPIMAALDTRTEVLHRVAQQRDGSYAGATVWVLAPKASEPVKDEKAEAKLPWISSQLASFASWNQDTTKQKEEYSATVYATYRAALNQFLRRSNLSVQWKEVTSDNIESVMRDASGKADCVVWTSTKDSLPISMPAGFSSSTDHTTSTPAEEKALVRVNGVADLKHRMTPLEDRLAMHEFDSPASAASTTSIGIDAHVLGGQSQPEAIYTGVVPIVYKAQRELLNSLIESTIWSFATITPLMMFVSRGVRAGSVVMIPNTLPVLVVFGGMGWLGAAVDIGSMMSASIALGVAVDDTIHFLTWFREELAKGTSRREALLVTYRRCASPTLQAAMISGLGLSIFAMSTFTPTQRFGWLMLTILLAGVVAELIMLPALLAGPLGNIFETSASRNPRRLTNRLVRTFLGSSQRADKASQDAAQVGRYHFGVKAFLRFLSR